MGPDDAAEAAAARLERSGIIYGPGHQFVLLIEEAALRYRIVIPGRHYAGRDSCTGVEVGARCRSIMRNGLDGSGRRTP